jgi:hypothetical protein
MLADADDPEASPNAAQSEQVLPNSPMLAENSIRKAISFRF